MRVAPSILGLRIPPTNKCLRSSVLHPSFSLDTTIFAFVFAEHFARYPNLSKAAAHRLASLGMNIHIISLYLLRANQVLEAPARSLLSLVRPPLHDSRRSLAHLLLPPDDLCQPPG